MIEINNESDIPKRQKLSCPVIDPFEEIIQKLDKLNKNIEIIKEMIWDSTRKE